MDMKIENIIASKEADMEFNPEDFLDVLENTEYNPKKFPGLIVKVKFPKSTVLVFRSGRVVSSGCRSIDDTEKSIDMVIEKMKEKTKDIKPGQMKIHNIVASFNINGRIKLDDLVPVLEVDGTVSYNPEKFPGVIFKDIKKGMAALIFDNGKVIITGGRVMEDTSEFADEIMEVLENSGVVEE